jgi:hypothetical protein
VLLTKATRDLVEGCLGGPLWLKRLGEFRLRDLVEPELIYQDPGSASRRRWPPSGTGPLAAPSRPEP